MLAPSVFSFSSSFIFFAFSLVLLSFVVAKSLLPGSAKWTNRFQSISCPSIGGCAATMPHIMQFDFSGGRANQNLAGLWR
jgi:hypothetical protein